MVSESRKIYARNWRNKNRKKLQKYQKDWREKNKEYVSKYDRDRWKNDPERRKKSRSRMSLYRRCNILD